MVEARKGCLQLGQNGLQPLEPCAGPGAGALLILIHWSPTLIRLASFSDYLPGQRCETSKDQKVTKTELER
jgi:hypothetical protein